MVMPSQAALQVFNQDFLWDNTNGIYWSRDTDLAGGMMNGDPTLSWIDALNAGAHPANNPSGHSAWRLPSYNEMSAMYYDYYGAYLNDGSYARELQDSQGNLIIQEGGYWATPFVPGLWGRLRGYEFDFLASQISSGPNDYGGNYAWLVTDIEPASVPTPIPGSLWLVTSGFMGLVAFRRRLAH
jgi:hypothetical protein